jgi:hypothetical protein
VWVMRVAESFFFGGWLISVRLFVNIRFYSIGDESLGEEGLDRPEVVVQGFALSSS